MIYKHYTNVLNKTSYYQLKHYFESIVSRGFSENQNSRGTGIFTKFKIYDSYSHSIRPTQTYPGCPYDYFFSQKAIRRVEEEFQIPLTNELDCTYHYALPNSKGGWIHTDNERQRFVDNPTKDGPFKGVIFGSKNTGPLERRRAIAGIFYLNDHWKEGDGGETCLYNSRNEDDILLTAKPVANSMILFSMSPTSFHRALISTVPRKVMVFWYHATMESGIDLGSAFLPGGKLENGG